MKKGANNPIQPTQLAAAPRCHAKTRQGTLCQSPVVKGRKRCRMHGGPIPGAPKEEGNGNWRHGACAAEIHAIGELLNSTRI
jgi:hypothetical protein